MHTTVDDNPLGADNPPNLPYFPLFSLPQASVPQMTNSGINRVFQATETIYSCSLIYYLGSRLFIHTERYRYSWIARLLPPENITAYNIHI